MKNLFSLLIIYFFTFTQISTAQEENIRNRNLEISIMPLALFDPYKPRLRLGLEYYSDRKISYGLDTGYGGTVLRASVENRSDYSFFEIRPRIKYSRFFNDRKHQFFLGLEAFKIKASESITDDYYRSLDFNSIVSFSRATYILKKKGLHFISGFVLHGKHISFEIYTGVGFANQQRTYTELKDIFVEEFHFPDSSFYKGIEERNKYEADEFIPHGTLGLKVSYILGKSNKTILE